MMCKFKLFLAGENGPAGEHNQHQGAGAPPVPGTLQAATVDGCTVNGAYTLDQAMARKLCFYGPGCKVEGLDGLHPPDCV